MGNNLKQSGWGIASLILFVVPILIFLLIRMYFYDLPAAIVNSMFFNWLLLAAIFAGLICGIVGLTKQGFKKSFAAIGVILNAGAMVMALLGF